MVFFFVFLSDKFIVWVDCSAMSFSSECLGLRIGVSMSNGVEPQLSERVRLPSVQNVSSRSSDHSRVQQSGPRLR